MEKNSAVRRAYASSAAAVARNAPDARVGKLVAEAVMMYSEPGDRDSRQLGGLLLRELARSAADVFGKHASQVDQDDLGRVGERIRVGERREEGTLCIIAS